MNERWIAERCSSFGRQRGHRTELKSPRELADWTRKILTADIDCCADGCCDPETVILVMRRDRSVEAIMSGKLLESITYADVEPCLLRPRFTAGAI
jgi:hypothetical protein